MTLAGESTAEVQSIGRELFARIPKLGEMEQARRGDDLPIDPALRREFHEAALNVIIGAALVQARLPGPDDVLWIAAAIEERRNALNVPVDHFLRALILSHQDVWEEAARVVEEFDADPNVLSPIGALLFEWSATIATQIVSAYRREEYENARADERARARLLHRIFSGDLQGKLTQDELLIHGISSNRPYLALRARAGSKNESERLERILLDHVGKEGGLVAPVGGDLAGIAPSRPPIEGLDAIIGLGPMLELPAVAGSFRVATKVFEVGQRLGLQGVVTLDDVGLDVALSSETDVGEHLEAKYLKPLADIGPFGDVLCGTLRAFVENRLNVERTARTLFVHPNTLRHRLDRFEEVTGANLDDMDDVFEVWWTLRRGALRDVDSLS